MAHLLFLKCTAPDALRWSSTATATKPKSAAPVVEEDPIEAAATSEKTPADERTSFETLKGVIHNDTWKAITVKPFQHTHMTPVQQTVLSLLPELARPHNAVLTAEDGSPVKQPTRDLLVKARTGTGKTLAFLVPAIEARLASIKAYAKQAVIDSGLNDDKQVAARAARQFTYNHTGTLILSPTRELAAQIAVEAERLTSHHKDFGVRLFVGGASKRQQMRDWLRGRRDIVVATPGRLRDLLTSEPDVVAGISRTQVFILDEADTMIDLGFRDDLDFIQRHLPPRPERQTLLFSATVSRPIQQIARTMLAKDHVFINTVSEDESPVHAHVPQFYTTLPSAKHQMTHLVRLIAHDQLSNPGKSKIILFLPTTKMTHLAAEILRDIRYTLPSSSQTNIYEIHSAKAQETRTSTSNNFRADQSGASILVTSDVSARGVDYPGVTRVIQIGVPSTGEQYIHRVGRTGRGNTTAGRGDIVVLPWEAGFLTWQLNAVPLKPTTTKEVIQQVAELVKKHDEAPAAFFPQVKAPAPITRGRTTRGRPAISSFPPRMEERVLGEALETNVKSSIERINPDVVDETFASMLGYYFGKAQELRVGKNIILDGLKEWATGAMGLPNAPHVSQSMLTRLGFSSNTRSDSRPSRSRDFEGRSSGPAWAGRGAPRNTSRDDRGPPRQYSPRPDSSSSSYGERRSSERSSYGGAPRRPSFEGSRDWPSNGGNFGERRSSYSGNRSS